MAGIIENKVAFFPKKWGFEKLVGDGMKIKFIVKSMSSGLHYHKKKCEKLFVQSGRVTLYYTETKRGTERVKACFNKRYDMGFSTDNLVKLSNDIFNLCGDREIYGENLKEIVLEKGDSFEISPGTLHGFYANLDSEIYEFGKMLENDTYEIKGEEK